MVYLLLQHEHVDYSGFYSHNQLIKQIMDYIEDSSYVERYVIKKYGEDFYGDLLGINNLTRQDLNSIIKVFLEDYSIYDLGDNIKNMEGKFLNKFFKLRIKEIVDILLYKPVFTLLLAKSKNKGNAKELPVDILKKIHEMI
jgi:hypothetical protein